MDDLTLPRTNPLPAIKVLIDTNVLFALEDTERILDPRLADIKRMAAQLHIELLLHPKLLKYDINNDRDEKRKNIIISRSKQYPILEKPPTWEQSSEAKPDWLKDDGNDFVDECLLCAVKFNAVHLLVTEDKKIHSKSIRLGVQDRVYYIEAFHEFLIGLSPARLEHEAPVGIKTANVYNFDVRNSFFDSLREGYEGFNDWFGKIAKEGRECWHIGDFKEIVAMVIFKTEDDETVTSENKKLPGKALKLCTFKVNPKHFGQKIGERLLYTAMQFAVQHHIDWVYLTVEDSHFQIETLCQDFGFEPIGIDIKSKRDHVWCKDMRTPVNDGALPHFDFSLKYYPHYRREGDFSTWLIPIQPRYHDMLFPDLLKRKDFLLNFLDDCTSYKSYSNTIKKAYLCHSSVTRIKCGDLIYFYCSHPKQKIYSVCIVEESIRSTDSQKIRSMIAKRTVYSQQEVIELTQQETLVILFRLLEYLPAPISMQQLEDIGIKGPIQSIRYLESALS